MSLKGISRAWLSTWRRLCNTSQTGVYNFLKQEKTQNSTTQKQAHGKQAAEGKQKTNNNHVPNARCP
jgi:hypothetical protein